DPVGREEMLALIRRTGREFGISIVLSTHLMGDVETTCDRIVVLERGQVVESGEVSGFTQETETIFIEVDGGVETLISELSERGLDCSLDGYSIAVQDVGGDEYDEIRDAVVDSRVRLRRLGPRRHRLTEIFRSER
ncbi:MAG: ABC transporter ATP-binding protein, partial [Dehalococcoidia bacterium]|nr:ABC transporter ATP-binding protein [Dehalococcoidia bacterium]